MEKIKKCKTCGVGFSGGRNKVFCSDKCRQRFAYLVSKGVKKKRTRKSGFIKKCKNCGATFKTARSKQKFCCPECCVVFNSRLSPYACKNCGKICFSGRYGKDRPVFCGNDCHISFIAKIMIIIRNQTVETPMNKASRLRRERMVKTQTEKINPNIVFMRDGWRCQICGKKLNQKNRGKHKGNSPEIDHIIPLAEGGRHIYKNLQTSCRACNLKKGANGHGQQLLLFGR